MAHESGQAGAEIPLFDNTVNLVRAWEAGSVSEHILVKALHSLWTTGPLAEDANAFLKLIAHDEESQGQ